MTSPTRYCPPLDQATARVAVIVPTRNEAAHIAATLDSVLCQTFPAERLYILAVDGMSEDGTREILMEYASVHPHFRVLDNPLRSTPTALNIGIWAAGDADVIVRVDGHCRVAPDFAERCVRLLAETGAANAGGLMRACGEGTVGRAISLALGSRFGIGNGRFHYLERQEWVDTVYLGAFRREVLDELGGFDEALIRNQDDELNYRIRAAGYGILLSPDIISTYTPRSSLRALWRQFYGYGFWKVRVIEKHPGSIQPRHLAPASLVLLLVASVPSGALRRQRRFMLPLWLYAAAVVSAAAWTGRGTPRLIPALMAVFPCMHFSYGAGFLHAATYRLLRLLRPTSPSRIPERFPDPV